MATKNSFQIIKTTFLKMLTSNRAEEVAYNVLDVFCFLGASHILQSDNGREFSNKVVKELLIMWPGCKLLHGKPRYSQSQGSVERANQDVESILACWLKENDTSHWAEVCSIPEKFRHHRGIGRSPYKAMFGENRYNGS